MICRGGVARRSRQKIQEKNTRSSTHLPRAPTPTPEQIAEQQRKQREWQKKQLANEIRRQNQQMTQMWRSSGPAAFNPYAPSSFGYNPYSGCSAYDPECAPGVGAAGSCYPAATIECPAENFASEWTMKGGKKKGKGKKGAGESFSLGPQKEENNVIASNFCGVGMSGLSMR